MSLFSVFKSVCGSTLACMFVCTPVCAQECNLRMNGQGVRGPLPSALALTADRLGEME